MLESDAKAIGQSQKSILGFDTGVSANLFSNQPAGNTAFSSELSRAKDSISKVATGVNESVSATAVNSQLSDSAIPQKPRSVDVSPISQSTGLSGTTPSNTTGTASPNLLEEQSSTQAPELMASIKNGVIKTETANASPTAQPGLQANIGAAATVVAEVGVELLSQKTDETALTGLKMVANSDADTNALSIASIAANTTESNGVIGVGVNVGKATSVGSDVKPTALDANPVAMGASTLTEKLTAVKNTVISGAVSDSVKTTTGNTLSNISNIATTPNAAYTANALNATTSVTKSDAELVATTVLAAKAGRAATNGKVEQLAVGTPGLTLSSSQAAGVNQSGIVKPDTAASLYKPSSALINSGLGRISVELSNGQVPVSSQAVLPQDLAALGQAVGKASPASVLIPAPVLEAGVTTAETALIKPAVQKLGVSTLSVGANVEQASNGINVPSLPASALSAVVSGAPSASTVANVEATTASIAGSPANTASNAAIAASAASASVTTSAAVATTATTATTTETAIATATTAAMNVKATAGSTTNAEPTQQESVTTVSINKTFGAENFTETSSDGSQAKNPHVPVAETASGKSEENVTASTLRHSIATELQNKTPNVTPGVTPGQAVQMSATADTSSFQASIGASDVTPSNVYHVTTSGIISANSISLNTGLPSDLVSAPRTLMLDQPGADQSLVDNLRWAVNEKLSRATINVSPANLGPITVSVDLENQNMNVSIITNSAVAKEAIDSLIPRMREHFSNDGYQQVSVDVSSQRERQSSSSEHSNQSSDRHNNAEFDHGYSGSKSQLEQSRQTSNPHRGTESIIDTYA